MLAQWQRRKTTGILSLVVTCLFCLAHYPDNNIPLSQSSSGMVQPCHLSDECHLARASLTHSPPLVDTLQLGETISESPLTQVSPPQVLPHQSNIVRHRHISKGLVRWCCSTTPAVPHLGLPGLYPAPPNLKGNVPSSAKHSFQSVCPPHVTILIAVLTLPSRFTIRQAIRETWGQAAKDVMAWPGCSLRGHVQLIFVLGQEEFNEQNHLEEELLKYNDMFFTNVKELYRNLTNKTLSVMDWFTQHCNERTFFLKTDDDMFLNIPHLLDLVASFVGQDVIIGHTHSSSTVLRSGPWSVPHSLYPASTFPPYVAGNAYLISGPVVRKLLYAIGDQPILPVEDAYITGVLRNALNISINHQPKFSKWRSARPHPCDFLRDRVYTGTRITPQYMHRIWEVLLQGGPCL